MKFPRCQITPPRVTPAEPLRRLIPAPFFGMKKGPALLQVLFINS